VTPTPRCWLTVLILLSALRISAVETNQLEWWSFKTAVKPPVPAANSQARNAIDQFVSAKRAENKLPSSPEADRRTLLRRVTFNLIGLPPTPEELSAFFADRSADAYEQVVDRLLASPRYGERWARHWLDTVHYGETHGYDKDKPRLNAWPYRDYVINSFNSDKPYSRFVQEQLAADALFPDQPELMPALGFIAAGPWDFVGHVELPITKTDGLIARYNDRDDMVMTAMSTFQSLTVHCARCHDHKFDPISARDYYGLQAVFAGVDRADRPYDSDAEVAKERRELNRSLEQLAVERKQLDAEVARLGGEELRELDRQLSGSSSAKPNKSAFGYHSQISLKQDTEKWVQVDLGAVRELDRVVLAGCHDDFNNIGAGFGFPLRYKVEAANDPEFRDWVVLIQNHDSDDVPNPGIAPQDISVCGCLTDDGSRVKARYVRVTATKLAPRQNDFIFALAELMVLNSAGENLARHATVTALDSIEAPMRWQKKNLVDGYHPGAETNGSSGALAGLREKRELLLQRLLPEETRLALARNEVAQKSARERLAKLPKPQTVYAATHEFTANGSFIPAREPRPVHLLKRGDVKRPGEEMKPAGVTSMPGVSPEFQISDLKSEGARRAALAKWIADTNNLLTRRSIVNRVWHYHFGRGLVETPNDFGHMGALPSHPELLDWLAFWFIENGESFKKLHRLIVTSAAYRQASVGDEVTSLHSTKIDQSLLTSAATKDSVNRYLWRMNRARLDAEQFRDAVLAISGQLDLQMGGPSVQQFAFKDDHSPVYDYARYELSSPGANRRGIYRFIVRSVPDPFLDALDCPDASILTPVRNTTMTALQALATLNDAFVLRQCEHFAARLQRERKTVSEQITRAYELALNRAPIQSERTKLVAHAEKHGLASACRVIFNSNEFMFLD
jgi:hypothetical protein